MPKLVVIGLAARLPGAHDVKELWRSLCQGGESDRPRSFHEWLEEQADRAPDTPAVAFERSVTYDEIETRANRLAQHQCDPGAGFDLPESLGQTLAVAEIRAAAGVAPSSIGLIKAHGSATSLCDPIEVAALERVFEPSDGLSSLGSVKSNIGHLGAITSFIKSFIKALLAVPSRYLDPVALPDPAAAGGINRQVGFWGRPAEELEESGQPDDRQGLQEVTMRRVPGPAESPVSNFAHAASDPNGGPPKVFYYGLLTKREDSRLVTWLREVTSGLLPRFGTDNREPLPQLILMLDASGSMSSARERNLSFRHLRDNTETEKGGRRFAKLLFSSRLADKAGSSWETLFQSLYGDSLSSSTTEPASLWGKKLARCLLSPAGRLPALHQFDRSRLIGILAELPGWEGEDGVLRSAWIQAAASNCHLHWFKEKEKFRKEERVVSWHAGDRYSFFLNRALSYPDRYLEEYGEGLSQLGGLTRAMSLAWLLLYRSLAVLPLEWRLSIRRSQKANLFTMAEMMARIWGVEVRAESLDHMNAFLVRMPHRAVIYLRKQLDPRHRAWGVCHELAHLVLGHTSHSSYGLDPRSLSPEEILMFDRQEASADALASLWLHLLEGLADIGIALGRSSRVPTEPRRRRSAAPQTWYGSPTWHHPENAAFASSGFSPPS